MARTGKIIVGILGLALSVTTLLLTTASATTTQANHRTHNYSIIGGNPDVTYYVNIQAPSPAMAVDILRLNIPNFEYPKPANAGKYDNRVKSFAQNWRSWNVAAQYRS